MRNPLFCSSLDMSPALTKHSDSSADDWAASRMLSQVVAPGGTRTRISGLVRTALYPVKLQALPLHHAGIAE